MATIVEVGTGYDKRRLQIGGEEFVRTFKFGSNWTKIRIGVLLGINGTANVTSNLVFGACAGTANTFNSATCDGFCGLAPVSYTSAPTWTYDATPYYSNASSNTYRVTKVGATPVATYLGFAGAWYWATAATPFSMWIITLWKSPSWKSIRLATASPNTAATLGKVVSDREFYLNMDHSFGSSYPYGMAGDFDWAAAEDWSANPDLDSCSIYWSSASPELHIAHVGVVRVF